MKVPIPPASFQSIPAPRRCMIAGACLASAVGVWLFLRPEGRVVLTEGITPASAKAKPDQAKTLVTPSFSALWHTPAPRSFETVSERVRADIDKKVSESGYAVSATEIAGNYVGSREEQRSALEAVISDWTVKDRPAASLWIAQHAGHVYEKSATLEHGLWEAALGGYVEGVLKIDPESAIIGADLLEPQTPVPIENAQNRSLPREVSETATGSQGPAELPAGIVVDTPATPPVASVNESGTTVTLIDSFAASERRRLFPGDPGFPGDPDFLSPVR